MRLEVVWLVIARALVVIIEGPPRRRRFDSLFVIATRFPDVYKENETMLYQVVPDHSNLGIY
jgi:hypothetical protein